MFQIVESYLIRIPQVVSWLLTYAIYGPYLYTFIWEDTLKCIFETFACKKLHLGTQFPHCECLFRKFAAKFEIWNWTISNYTIQIWIRNQTDSLLLWGAEKQKLCVCYCSFCLFHIIHIAGNQLPVAHFTKLFEWYNETKSFQYEPLVVTYHFENKPRFNLHCTVWQNIFQFSLFVKIFSDHPVQILLVYFLIGILYLN